MAEEKLNKRLAILNNEERDTLILTWKKPIKNGIFFPFSTWTSGRNRLYQEIVNRGLDKKYLYFIFMDEDFYIKSKTKNKPFKEFEKNLEKYLPAIGFPYYKNHKKGSKEISIFYKFDAGLFAVHNKALHTLFPYFDTYDKKNWCYSQAYFFYLASILYERYILQFNKLESINSESKSYYGHLSWNFVYKSFIKTIKNQSILKKFKQKQSKDLLNLKGIIKKTQNYNLDTNYLSKIFYLNSPLWKRRIQIQKYIKNKRYIPRYKLSYIGEISKNTIGINMTNLFFSPLIKVKIILKKIKSKVNKANIEKNIGRVGIYLKKNHPKIFIFLKKFDNFSS